MVIDILLDNGKHLLLDADAQIEWVQENMFFEEDVRLRGKYSYPFSIDRKANSDALSFPDLIQVNEEIIKVGCRVYVTGIEFYKGQLNILDWDDDVINVAITRNTDEIDTNKFIDEIDLPEYTAIADHTNRNNDKQKFYPEVDYAFPQFYCENEASVEKFGSDSRGNLDMIVNWRNGDSQAADGTEVAVPMFYWLSVLKHIFLKLGQGLKTNLHTDSFFKRLLVYNPVAAVETSPNCLHIESYTYAGGYGTIRMTDKISCFNVPVGTIISMYVYEYDQYGINVNNPVILVCNSTDVLSVSNLMTALRTEFLSSVSNATLISEDYTADLPSFTVQINTGDELFIQAPGKPIQDLSTRVDRLINKIPVTFNDNRSYELSVKMIKHLPHITISALLNASRSYFNLAIFLDEVNEVVKIYRRNDIVQPYNKQDMSEYVLNVNEGEPYKAPNYKFTFDHDSGNDSLTETLQSETSNIEAGIDPVTKWETPAGTLVTELLRNSNSGFITMPKVNQELGDYSDKPSFGLRFLYLNGYNADTNGKFVVSATNDGLLPDQVFNNQFKDWYNILKRMRKAPVMYMDFGFDKLKSMEPFAWKVMNNDFLWKRITTTIHNTNGILPSKVEGYKL